MPKPELAGCPFNRESCIHAELRTCTIVIHYWQEHTAKAVDGVTYIPTNEEVET